MSTQLEHAPKEFTPEAEKATSRLVFTPRADIFETEDDIVVMSDLPGVDESSIDVSIEKNILSIRAHVEPCAPEKHSLTYSEYTPGDYERKFTLPNEIDRDGITATFKNGVLKLTLPKSAHSRLKKITVSAE